MEFLETFDEDSDDEDEEECPNPTRATSVECPNQTRATSVEDSSDFIFAVGEDVSKYEPPMIDSGAAHSVCSKWYAEDYALTQERTLHLTHAGGGTLKHLGDRTNVGYTNGESIMKVDYAVMEQNCKPLLAVSERLDRGQLVLFSNGCSKII